MVIEVFELGSSGNIEKVLNHAKLQTSNYLFQQFG